jgi:hypothetical protein
MKPYIIALCGFANAGKDTVADLLVAHAGFRKLAFADALKAELEQAFSIEPSVFIRPEYKSQPMRELALTRCTDRAYVDAALRYGVEHWTGTLPYPTAEELARARTPRETMQLWGTQYRRAHDPEYWTSILRRRISYYQAELGQMRIVVTDCRYDNEHESLRAQGARLWQVKRPGLNADTTAEGGHSSATDGARWAPNIVINNAHDLRHLQTLVLQEWWAIDAGLTSVKAEITP